MICSIDYPAEKFAGYNNSAGVSVSSWYSVPWDIETIKTNGIAHSTVTNPAEITFLKTGYYLINVRIGVYSSTGTTRSETEAQLQIDTGGGFANIIGSYSNSYHRQATVGRNGLNIALLKLFSANDKLRAQVQTRVGANLYTLADASSIEIVEIK